MDANTIRATFIKYFEDRGHTFVPSWPVVPKGDPTLLFTNAGMNQFKDVLLGKEKRSYKRAVNSQKCLRVSGKHNDLETVGKDDYHHTFFEMLGNWSFGDYFKREAIEYAWELLTGVYKISPDRLWATVYIDDSEAENCWLNVIGLPKERVLRFDERYNFWEMGPVGPCGPCTEIHYDYGEEYGCGKSNCGPNCGCGRFVEVWNLVFMQFFRDETGALTPLPQKNVDTGMGFERLVAILQGKRSNYETDIFKPLIEKIEGLSGKSFRDNEYKTPMRVIADHIRALAFAIADGVIPGNEGRGYVVRRLLRRAVRYGRKLGFHEPFLAKLLDPLISSMGKAYPELSQHLTHITNILNSEEERFNETLDRGIELFESLAKDLIEKKEKIVHGKDIFRLYDTYGFPLDLTQIMAEEKGLELDVAGFERELENQRALARQASKFVHLYDDENWVVVHKHIGRDSVFVGYSEFRTRSHIVKYKITNDTYLLILDRTPFWGESGGQVGDTGTIESEDFRFEVFDCKRDGDRIIHFANLREGKISDAEALASIDIPRRLAIAKNHTATHLLHNALRTVLGEHIRQAGSLVAPNRLRFDYTHYRQPTEEELAKLEQLVNEYILRDANVRTYFMKYTEAINEGVIAIFEEKYGEEVRVVEIEGISRELCGGTHISRTSQAGCFVIVKEESVASGIRRIEALTGESAYNYIKETRRTLKELSQLLKAQPEECPQKLASLIEENKNLKAELEKVKKALVENEAKGFVERGIKCGDSLVIVESPEITDAEELLYYIDTLKVRLKSGCAILISELGGKVSMIAYCTSDLVKRGITAKVIVNQISPIIGGKGGGKDELARAGGSDTERITEAIERARIFVLEKLKATEAC